MFVLFYSCNFPRREVYQFLNFGKLNLSRSTPDTETAVNVCVKTQASMSLRVSLVK